MSAYVMSERTARYIRGLMTDRRPPSSAEAATRRTRPQAIQEDEFAHPFEVRWATSESGWIIWIPSDECLMVGSAPVDVAEWLDSAEAYPAGWYRLAEIGENATAVYLNVTPPAEEDDETIAESDDSPDEDATWSILVATMDGKAVKQNVDSAIVLGSGVLSLNGMGGHLEIEADPNAFVSTGDTDIYAQVTTDEDVGKVLVGLTDHPPAEEDDGDGYCNSISHDGIGDDYPPSNDISGDYPSGTAMNGAIMTAPDNNQISRWPCRKAS